MSGQTTPAARTVAKRKPTHANTVPDSEKSLIAAALEELKNNPAVVKAALSGFDTEWLTVEGAADALASIVSCAKAGTPHSADVTSHIRSRQKQIGKPGVDAATNLLIDCASKIATSPQAYRLGLDRYANDVEAAHRQRVTLAHANDIAAKAAAGTIDVSDVDLLSQEAERLKAVLERRGGATRRLVLVPVSEIESSPVNWLWPQRVVGDGLTIVTGPVGNTKSLFTIDCAARVSLGAPWPDGTGHATQGSVILFGAEDDAGKIVKPRLEAAGADLSRVLVCQGATSGDDDNAAAVVLEHHIAQLRAALDAKPDCRLIVFDPLPDYVAADENNSAEVRAALIPLARLAQEKNVAVLAVLHQNKKNDLTAVQRIGGSGAFAQIARTVLAIGDHPEDDAADAERRRVMLVAKNNYGEKSVGQGYRLRKRGNGNVCIEWIAGTLTMDADALARRPNGGREHDEKRGEAVDALREQLASGSASAATINTMMRDAGFGRRQIDRAADSLNVVKEKQRDGWYWRLPAKSSPLTSDYVEPHAEFAAFDHEPGVPDRWR
jgi:putative DNA primase/helicase